MSDAGTIAVAIIGSGAFTTIINAIIELLKNHTGRKSNSDKAIEFCLLYNLQEYGNQLCQQDYVTREEYNQFCEMYKAYKNMPKANGYAERLMNLVNTVPIVDGRRTPNA